MDKGEEKVMPVYEYRCPKCRKRYEVFKQIYERYEAECPKCKVKLELVPSVYNFQFKESM